MIEIIYQTNATKIALSLKRPRLFAKNLNEVYILTNPTLIWT